MKSYWTDKTVLITGASSGIGEALALEMSGRGAAVGLVARRADLIESIAGRIESAGGRALALPADVRDAAALREASDRMVERFGRIDVLVANAGVGALGRAAEIDPAEVERVIRINLLGAANAVAAVLPRMIERKSGHLVAISSLAGYRGLPNSFAYCSSKAGLSSMFEAFRLDLRAHNIAVSIIHPGFIKTPLTAPRKAKMPFLMELDDATRKILRAIERRKKTCAFPWQLATIVRAAMLMPAPLYDFIVGKNSFRE